jgi:sigma-54 dependent transcriptional regulator, acetoin dehydrogenase operon transcriptional activator AcoR
MTHGISSPLLPTPLARLDGISRARTAVLTDGMPDAQGMIEPWIARSWRRCLGMGQQPQQAVHFEMLPHAAGNRTREANRQLADAARQVLHDLGRALADTRYFAILTNADGVVVDRNGPIDRSDRRADLITRIGVDLSERSVGTTAIGAALGELQPVWLHRGEHFFDDTAAYSCAGAPLFGPTGECVGMLDLTGVDVPERPELLHLAVQSARGIENALALAQAHDILLRLSWPGHPMGGDTDGLVGLDADGVVTTSNRAARAMVPRLGALAATGHARPHVSELFALPFEMLFDAARREPAPIDVPLWSGLRLQALAIGGGTGAVPLAVPMALSRAAPNGTSQHRLRDIETELIRKAVQETGGNVAQAALRLGVSRATVYRKLGLRKR